MQARSCPSQVKCYPLMEVNCIPLIKSTLKTKPDVILHWASLCMSSIINEGEISQVIRVKTLEKSRDSLFRSEAHSNVKMMYHSTTVELSRREILFSNLKDLI